MKNIRILGFGCGNKSARKINLIAVMVCCILAPQIGYCAVTKCINLNSSARCSSPVQIVGTIDWSLTCNNIKIQGIGICSSTFGERGEIADTITVNALNTENIYCWCKMTMPAVSQFVATSASSSDCSYQCAYKCSFDTSTASSFRSALFSNLSE